MDVEERIWSMKGVEQNTSSGVQVSAPKKGNVNFRLMVTKNVYKVVDMSIPRKNVDTISERYENTLYGYFIGKRMAFLVVEYYDEWKPPRCDTYKIYRHTIDDCPKKVVVAPHVDHTNDGFQQVVNKKRNTKAANSTFKGDGVRGDLGSKGSPNQPLNKGGASTSNASSTSGKDPPNQSIAQHDDKGHKNGVDKVKMKIFDISTPNPFAPLEEDEDE
ncbi:hypothetical protein Tco_1550104 [Tanacetum coccineum]